MIEHPLNHHPTALFVGVPPEFTCDSICFNVLKDAVSCTEGHNVCRGCADKLRSKKCPVCNEKLKKLVPNRAVNEAIGKAEVRCFTRLDNDGNLVDDENDESAAMAASNSSSSSSSRGGAAGGKRKAAGGGNGKAKKAKVDACDWVGPLKDAEKHFRVCPYAGVRCPHKGCGALVARRDLDDHEESCNYRPQLCKWAGCGKTFVGATLAVHEDKCDKREVVCPNDGCAQRVAFDVLEFHRHKCRFETVACPFAGVGCKLRMVRKDVRMHERAAMKKHNRLLLAKVCALQQVDEALRTEVRDLRREVNMLKRGTPSKVVVQRRPFFPAVMSL